MRLPDQPESVEFRMISVRFDSIFNKITDSVRICPQTNKHFREAYFRLNHKDPQDYPAGLLYRSRALQCFNETLSRSYILFLRISLSF